jgi:hypothetical protein
MARRNLGPAFFNGWKCIGEAREEELSESPLLLTREKLAKNPLLLILLSVVDD